MPEYAPRAASFGLEAAEAMGVDPSRVFKTIVTLVDESLLGGRTVFVSPGRRGLETVLSPEALVALTGATVAPIAHRPSPIAHRD